jgi:hypothetical protein
MTGERAYELKRVLRQGPFACDWAAEVVEGEEGNPYETFLCKLQANGKVYEQWVRVPRMEPPRHGVREIAERLELDLVRRIHKERRES